MEGVEILTVNTLSSAIFINEGNFSFTKIDLPQEAQLSPIYAIADQDADGDGDNDLFLGGNLFRVKPEVGIYDATYGVYLENQKGVL